MNTLVIKNKVFLFLFFFLKSNIKKLTDEGERSGNDDNLEFVFVGIGHELGQNIQSNSS